MSVDESPDDGANPFELHPDVWRELEPDKKSNYVVKLPDGDRRYFMSREGAADRIKNEYGLAPREDTNEDFDPFEMFPDVWRELEPDKKSNYVVKLPDGDRRYFMSREGAADRIKDEYCLADAPEDSQRITKVQCSHCDEMVYAYRTKSGRIVGATGGALVLGGVGASVGAGIGIATGGWGAPATYYLGSLCAAIGGAGGYIAGGAADTPECPNCEGEIELGI